MVPEMTQRSYKRVTSREVELLNRSRRFEIYINKLTSAHITVTFVQVYIKICFPATHLLLAIYFCLLASFHADQLSNIFHNGRI